MTKSQKWVSGALAIATGLMVGCATPTAQTSQTSPVNQTQAISEDTLTRQETTLADAKGYSVQQYGGYWFGGRRCRWFWVPYGWGYGWGYYRYHDYWDRGRWVLICSRRYIPYWWYYGPWVGYGGYGGYGYDRRPPRFRPRFDRDRFGDDGRPRGRFGGPGGFGGPGMGDEDEDRGPRFPRGPRNPSPDT